MAQYPTAAGTDSNLWVAANNKSTTLSDNPLSSGATTVNVASTTGFPTSGYITIDAEAIKYTGVTATSFTTCTRGADGTAAASHTLNTSVFHDVVADHHNVLKDEIKAIEGDLVAINSALTPASATSTSTSLLNRVNMIVNQIKNGFGLTNWYDAVTAMMPKSGGAFTANISFSPTTAGITGTTTNDSATAGTVGEQKVTQQSSTSTFPSTGTIGDFLSVSLTAGDWDVCIVGEVGFVTATSVFDLFLGVSTTSGNSQTGMTIGTSRIYNATPPATSGNFFTYSLPNVRMSLSGTTTVYFKYGMNFSTATPILRGEIRARRVR